MYLDGAVVGAVGAVAGMSGDDDGYAVFCAATGSGGARVGGR